MNFHDLKDKLKQIRELIRVESDNVFALNASRCLALIFLADYYQVYYAFKYSKWNDCAMHSLASKLAKVERIFISDRTGLVESLDMIILDRCSYAHGDVDLETEEINVDDIEKFTDVLDSLITPDIYDKVINLDINGYARN
ncbi:hypothetical protein [Clostridium sp.]|uniref:hypothetical protein n=1 Tax=Clostridium sp. TaxID=1506 RepID=UPI00261B9CB7|nr:hypothetical protein [Clostridium sp.]